MDIGEALTMGANRLVSIAGIIAAVLFLWSKVVAPLIFRPIGKALAHGARREAEAAVRELVDPQLELLRSGQAALERSVQDVGDALRQVLDRMPPTP